MTTTVKREKEVLNMVELIPGCYYLNDEVDLVHSLEDSAWFIQEYKGDRKTSIGYETRKDACRAYIANCIEWQ
mgnify:CR=1 FL=1